MTKRDEARGAARLARASRKRPSHSTVVAYLALFIALGGTGAWAAEKITSKDIAKNAVLSKHIKKNAVGSKQIKRNAVKAAKIATGAVNAGKLADGSVLTGKLADNSVSTGKIAADAVNAGKLADGSVLTGKLADNSVSTAKIADGSVNHAKLSSDASPRWGVFNNGGALVQGRGVVASASIGTAVYEVTFDRDVSQCAWSATVARNVAAEPVSGEIGVRPPASNPNGVVVHTWNSAGAPAINRFHLLVIC